MNFCAHKLLLCNDNWFALFYANHTIFQNQTHWLKDQLALHKKTALRAVFLWSNDLGVLANDLHFQSRTYNLKVYSA
ncbi:MAG: hypothetical protein DPW09_35530 [Anaerolineae bacterium]|nr:hypothetical protein [Anaerolineae bacterium]